MISEVILYGLRARVLPVHTGAILGGQHIGCCLLGGRILVLSRQRKTANRGGRRGRNGEEFKMFAALVEVEDGRLSKEIIRVTALTARGARSGQTGLSSSRRGRAGLCCITTSRPSCGTAMLPTKH